MSATYIAYTIIGSKVDRSDFFIQSEESVHKDCEDMGTVLYCPACGKSIHAVDVVSTPVPGFEPEGGKEFQGRIGSMDIFPMGNGGNGCFLAFARHKVTSGDPPEVFRRICFDIAREALRGTLEPLDLWVPRDFGVWTAMYFGY